MSDRETDLRVVYVAISFQTIIAAATYLIAKEAMFQLAPLVFAFFRFVLAAAVFLVVMAIRGSHFPLLKSRWRLLLLLSILAVPLNQCFFLVGLSYTQPTHPALLYATTPIWVYLLSGWRHEEKFTREKSWGVALALAGVVAFFLEKGINFKVNYLLGDSLVMIAVWSWATYTVLGRPLVKREGAMTVTSLTLVWGTFLFFPLGAYAAARFDYSQVTWVAWSGVVYTALFTSVIAYTLWYWTIKHIEASRACIFMNLQPVLTAILAYFLMDERLSAASIISGVVILGGVYIAQMQ